jgi:hypothetical protein
MSSDNLILKPGLIVENGVNPNNAHTAGIPFSSTDTTRYGLPAASNNVDAAMGKVSCQSGGGKRKGKRSRKYVKLIKAKTSKKINKRKIKNISNMYKMKGKRHTKRMKRMLRSRSKRRHTRTRTRARAQRGGTYDQFGSRVPSSPGYTLNPNVPSALANPMPFKSYNDCGDVNHFNNPATNSNAGSIFSNLKNLF